MSNKQITATVQLRLARKSDFLIGQDGLKSNVWYYVTSIINPGVLCGPLRTYDGIDKKEIRSWFKANRLFVPVGAVDAKCKLIQM